MKPATPATFKIAGRAVGRPHPALIVAEVALAHDGSLGVAHSFVDAVAATGAEAIKFQTHIAEAESSPLEPFRVPFSTQDATRYDYWKRTEFSLQQWRELAAHAREKNLLFLSSPFSPEAADWLQEVGVPAWKVASGEVTNQPLLEKLAGTGLPLLVSTGLSGWAEIESLASWLRDRSVPHALFQCTSAYPCPPHQWGLNVLEQMEQRFACPVGLSDHSGTIFPGLAAVTLGASLLEVHVTLSREMFGPDVSASLTPQELQQLVSGIRMIEEALAHPLDKDTAAAAAQPLREIFMKSIFTACELPAGTTLRPEHLVLRKPGTGIPPNRLHSIIGRKTKRALPAGQILREEDVGT